jgi:hypothetical protein
MKKYKPYLTRVDLVKNQVERERIQEQEAAKKRKQRIQEQNRQSHLRYQEQLRSELAARYFHGVVSAGGEVESSLLLDDYPAARAYSLRKLSSTYTGNAVRVRRGSDNTEQDIGFVNGELDTTSLLSFVGSATGFVTTWYDQSGNTNDATMPTNVNQPQIVSSGTLVEESDKPAIEWVSNDSLAAPRINELHNGTKCFVAAVVKSVISSTGRQSIIATSQNFTSNRGYTLYLITNPGTITSNIFNSTTPRPSSNTTNSDYPHTSRYLVTDIIDADESTAENRSILNINDGSDVKNNTLTGTPTALDSTRGLMIGYQNTDSFFRGRMQEIVIYTDDQTSNRTAIKNNINTHYSIY